MTNHVRYYLFAGLVAVLTLAGFMTAYQFFESNNNETYCASLSSKFCKSNPLELPLQENKDTSDTLKQVEIFVPHELLN